MNTNFEKFLKIMGMIFIMLILSAYVPFFAPVMVIVGALAVIKLAWIIMVRAVRVIGIELNKII